MRDQGLTQADRISVETLGGPLELIVETDEQVTVDMGTPIFAPEQIPFVAEQAANQYQVELKQRPSSFPSRAMIPLASSRPTCLSLWVRRPRPLR